MDAEEVTRSFDGDAHHLPRRSETAFRTHYGVILAFLTRRTGDAAAAEDMAQQVFLNAVERLDGSTRHEREGDESVLAWLFTVAQRRFYDDLRQRRRGAIRLQQLQDLHQAETREFGADVTRALERGIARLSQDHRAVVVAKLLEGRAFADIARDAGIAEPTARMRYSRALAELRAHLTVEGVDP